MSEAPVPKPPGDPEWKDLEKEFLDRRDFGLLLSTSQHYLGNRLALVLGFIELTLKHPQFPNDQDHKEIVQFMNNSSRRIAVTKAALDGITYDTRIIEFGKGMFIFDVGNQIQAGLNPTEEPEVAGSKPHEEGTTKQIHNKFKVLQDTIDHHIGSILSTPRSNFEILEDELEDKPTIHELIQLGHEGVLEATAARDVVSHISPDTETTSDGSRTWYKLDNQIQAKFELLQAENLEIRRPD